MVNYFKYEFTRGDTFKKEIKLYKNGVEYTPIQGDVIRFAAKKSYTDRLVAIEKQVPIDTMIFELRPEDTDHLKYGVYIFEMELETYDGEVYTFAKGNLTLLPEVK